MNTVNSMNPMSDATNFLNKMREGGKKFLQEAIERDNKEGDLNPANEEVLIKKPDGSSDTSISFHNGELINVKNDTWTDLSRTTCNIIEREKDPNYPYSPGYYIPRDKEYTEETIYFRTPHGRPYLKVVEKVTVHPYTIEEFANYNKYIEEL